MRVLVVGISGGSNVGGSFFRASRKLGLEAELCDTKEAWCYGTILQSFLWHVCGRRPARLRRFSDVVFRRCESFKPDLLISTGMSPIQARALRRCREQGICCVNFSTDDPFSQVQRKAGWFLSALREYDAVFTPRRANQEDLKRHGCRVVEYLPFGYDPELFYEPGTAPAADMESDLFFAGAADRGRLPFIAASLEAGLSVRLHGHSWDRYPSTRGKSAGQADIPVLRKAIQGCRVALCLVRHENRDGHAMRSFEVPAVGACMVVEDTEEHRYIFGRHGERVAFFNTPGEMVEQTNRLLKQPGEREHLKVAARDHIRRGRNTYADRLETIVHWARNQNPQPLCPLG